MKCHRIFPASLLLLWTLTGSVTCNDGSPAEMVVKTLSDGIELSCAHEIRDKNGTALKFLRLPYSDDNTGEYSCVDSDGNDEDPKIYVKFRSCDNCVELDLASVMGIAVGNVAATIVIGVAVYLLTSQNGISPTTSHKKSSDRQHLVPNEVSSRAPNDHYQPLKHKGGQRDTYDVLSNRR
ncbi:T-cell surface glycoprotein CD3 gamma chain-like [Chelmon rostratus]|uniref:T-cell surface glycoprotein CD3 gamma chain-like n=1 Tax=Chelmon rostratus TaxID=109905 RepID=UPI001BE56654|nr:T-cell surface glycoprotein CD3 gamma chain-like [Chelmon rostratus]XP_041796738.1 T-cell surface glycoprotein CD3 gamma chain-like [Chelmon rostratus]